MSTTTNAVSIEVHDIPHVNTAEKSPAPFKSGDTGKAVFAAAFLVVPAVAVAGIGLAASLASRVSDLENLVAAGNLENLVAGGEMPRGGKGAGKGVILSTDATPPIGYHQSSSLLTGGGQWATGTDMPSERSDLQSLSCGGQLLLLGGLNHSGVVVGNMWAFDPINEIYSEQASMPTPRYRFGAACVSKVGEAGTSHMLYVAGGFADADTGNSGQSLATVDIFDVASGVWTSGPSLTVARGDLALAAVGETLFAIGGYDWSYNTMDTMEVLDTLAATPAWMLGAAMPHPKGDVQAAVVASKIYVPGGWNAESTFLTSMLVYDPAAGSWSEAAPMSAPRGDKAVVALDGRIFVIGGEMWSGSTSTCDWGWGPEDCAVNLIPMHGVEMYSPEDDAWTHMAPLPASRFRFAAAAISGRLGAAGDAGMAEGAIFAFGGHAHGEVAVKSMLTFHFVPRPNVYIHTKD